MTDKWTNDTYWTGTGRQAGPVPSHVDLPCPLCGHRFIWCIPLVKPPGTFNHCKYICCNWDCRWSGWTVPTESGTLGVTIT